MLEGGQVLQDAISYFTRFQEDDPTWFKKSHRRKRVSADNHRNHRHSSSNEQCDSGFSGETAYKEDAQVQQPAPYYYNPNNSHQSDDMVKGFSLFPYDSYNGHEFIAPIDLHGDVRMKSTQRLGKSNTRHNEVPLHTAAIPLPCLNNSDNLTPPLLDGKNSSTSPSSQRSVGFPGREQMVGHLTVLYIVILGLVPTMLWGIYVCLRICQTIETLLLEVTGRRVETPRVEAWRQTKAAAVRM